MALNDLLLTGKKPSAYGVRPPNAVPSPAPQRQPDSLGQFVAADKEEDAKMTTMRATQRLLAAAAGARLAYAALTRVQHGGEQAWTRTNHRGEPVTLLEGPAVTVAAAGAALAVPGLDARSRLALGLAAAGDGALGCYDDLAGGNDRHGFRGHLGALARGEVTTGAVKIAGIGAAALAPASCLTAVTRAAGRRAP